MTLTDVLGHIGTFIVGCVTGGGFTLFAINRQSSKVTQNNNVVGGDLTAGGKNDQHKENRPE
ncbi:hypothetical protein VKA11_20800 [Bacillus paranthracis]|uniref:hypothetical protein n=1 Tax=Bacillus TaxID=1386 RepID=UPI000A37B2B4|nr:hypothetical protein [Bacillus sp. FF-1]MDC7739535.1 hypothetical protein [Bacillus sp. FF-1]OUA62373.1 hypothetical protein BK786_28910 [Bacillus thuringiensis serovar thailandensis]